MSLRWTDQSTPGVLKCGQCDYIFPEYSGAGPWFESKDGSARTKYDAILSHTRVEHPDFYARRWAAEVAPTGIAYPGWEPGPQ